VHHKNLYYVILTKKTTIFNRASCEWLQCQRPQQRVGLQEDHSSTHIWYGL